MVCGGQLEFTKREGTCTVCRTAIDRDRNASYNIREVAVQLARDGTRPAALARPNAAVPAEDNNEAEEEAEDNE